MPTESAALPHMTYNKSRAFCRTQNWKTGIRTRATATELALLPEVILTQLHSETERPGVIPSFTIDFHCRLVG
jgi:hypothetical protein